MPVGKPISGKTRLAGILGMPVNHSLSPAMHNAAYRELDFDWAYVPLGLKHEDDLERVLRAIRVLPFVGFNVTMPFKQAMLTYCDEVAMAAKMAGAVNTVHCVDGRLVGYNTDGRGLVESLAEEARFTSGGESITIIGAGGAAGAAAVAFILEKAGRVAIVNRTVERAEELADRLMPYARSTEIVPLHVSEAEEQIRESRLLINATPTGMAEDDPSPVPVSWISRDQIVCDMVYNVRETALLKAACDAGALAIGGLGMLVHQAALAIDIWSETAQHKAPRDLMRSAAQAVLSSTCSGEVIE